MQPWSFVSMNFIVDLPPSKSFDCICVVVDRFSKMAHFVPCKKTITSEDKAKLFIDNIYRYHGLLDGIVFDRGPQFVSKFWQSMFKILQVEIKLSSAFHPQIDGQTERVNQIWSNICVVPSIINKTVGYLCCHWQSLLTTIVHMLQLKKRHSTSTMDTIQRLTCCPLGEGRALQPKILRNKWKSFTQQ